jgi:glucosylceramidase
MKDSKKMVQGGKLLPEFYETWARYFVRTIEEYEKAGIPIWGLSAQNEPMAVQRWESCLYTAEEERDFIKNHLGPTLKKSGLGEKKIIAWDHNRDLIYQRASVLLSDPEAASYVWGLGFHWYETWTGSPMMFENLSRVKEAFPNINLLFTEGCVEGFDQKRISDWSLGERYGRSLMGDLNAGAVGWTDWNILLDETGGPNHVGNFCFAPIHANTKTGEIQYTNSYYYLGHFSKFVLPGAKRIATSVNRQDLLASAFLNPDGSLVAVVMNTSDKPLDYTFWMKGKATDIKALPRSISTFIF